MSINYDFFVYQVYHERESNKFFVNTFVVTAPGHVIAQSTPGEHPESFNALIRSNSLLSYYRSSKRIGAMSSASPRGSCEFKGRTEITRQQADFFARNRQMNP